MIYRNTKLQGINLDQVSKNIHKKADQVVEVANELTSIEGGNMNFHMSGVEDKACDLERLAETINDLADEVYEQWEELEDTVDELDAELAWYKEGFEDLLGALNHIASELGDKVDRPDHKELCEYIEDEITRAENLVSENEAPTTNS